MIRIITLGAARVDIRTRNVRVRVTPAAGKRFALLLYLVGQPGYRAARTTLRDLLLPATANGSHGLRELLYQVRQGGVEIDADAHTVQIPPKSVRRDWTAITEGAELTPSLVRSAEGGFLPGYRPSVSSEFADWYARFYTTTVAELCRGMLRHAERALKAKNLQGADQAARACLALDPSSSQAIVALAYGALRNGSIEAPAFDMDVR
jgi:hypothetical protein